MKTLTKQSEKDIQNSILGYLRSKKVFAWPNQTMGVFDPTKKMFRKSNNVHSINGVSDILGVYKGRFLAIEVKTPQNKVRTESQNTFINHINERGGLAFYATSIDDVEAVLGTV